MNDHEVTVLKSVGGSMVLLSIYFFKSGERNSRDDNMKKDFNSGRDDD